MWDDADFTVEAVMKSSIPEGMVEELLEEIEEPFIERVQAMAHEIELQKRAIEWQSKANASKLAALEGQLQKARQTIRDHELRISDLISADRATGIRRYVRTRLEEMLLEL